MNSGYKVLKTSESIRKEIIKLMSSGSQRRIAITAFVGSGARAYIPKPKGVEIICWPKAGGTNPNELRRLKQMGAEISFVDSLHMKLYLAKGQGALITSANLSTNALGSGNLKEFGVLIPDKAIDIDELIAFMKPRRFNKMDIERLEMEHRSIPPQLRANEKNVDRMEFSEWLTLPEPARWKLGWYEKYGAVAKSAKEVTQINHNVRGPADFLACGKRDYKKSDWVLTFRLKNKGGAAAQWMYIDYIVKVGRNDRRAFDSAYPYQAIQVWPSIKYTPPPFTIDKEFRSAFRLAVKEYGVDNIRNLRTTHPPKRLLEMIGGNLR